MTSPEPSGYPHHHPHPHMYSHHHQEAPPPAPVPTPPPPPHHHLPHHHPHPRHHQGMASHEGMYSDRPAPSSSSYHPHPQHLHHPYNPPTSEHPHNHHHHHQPPSSFSTPPPPPPPPHPLPQHGELNSSVEPEQPLDLSLSRSPRPASAGTLAEGGPALVRPMTMMEEDGSASITVIREGPSDLGRGDPHHQTPHPHHQHQPSSNVCMVRGCSCRQSPVMPVHHTPHYSRGHRHSPYPQYSVSSSSSSGGGHSSLAAGLGGGDVRESPYSPAPHSHHLYSSVPPHQLSPSPLPSSSSTPGMLYGGRASPPYVHDRRSRSPGLGVGGAGATSAVYSGEMASAAAVQRRSPGSLLCPLPQSSVSPLSIATHVPSDSCSPPSLSSCLPPQTLAAAGRMREVSPRPFYRPFEDGAHTLADVPHAAPVISSSSNSRMGGPMEPYPSEDDLSASSTLLMLSNTTSEANSGSSGRPTSAAVAVLTTTRQTADSSVDHDSAGFRHHREQQQQHAMLMMEDGARAHHHHQTHAEPSQSDSGSRTGVGMFQHPPLLSSPYPSSHANGHHHHNYPQQQPCGNREARNRDAYRHAESQQSLGPAQDGTVASSFSSDDLTDSPSPARGGDGRRSRGHPHQQYQQMHQQARMDMDSPSPTHEGEGAGGKKKHVQPPRSPFVTVVGTTPLATLRKERAKNQAANEGNMKDLLARRSNGGDRQRQRQHSSNNSNDSEGAGSDLNSSSSGQASPRSSDGGLDNDVGQGFPIPPDPNLKMSALDYLISKVLVERRDVPFKACNTEIQEIYTGAKKGRLTLVDLIELQVEASLKA